jgi:ankyrin repeat protein
MTHINTNIDLDTTKDFSREILDLLPKLRSNEDEYVISYIDSHKNVDYNVQDDNGIYFIMYVVALNKPHILKKLLTTTIKLDSLDADGKSIMYMPIKFGFIDIVNLLLEHDEKIIGVPLKHLTDINGNTALHYSLIFHNIECIKLLLRDSKCSLQDKNKKNALHYAVGTRNTEIVELILQNTTDIDSQDNSGETPLHVACRLSLYDIVHVLLKHGANPNITEYERTSIPLHYACYNGHDKIVKILLDNGSDINAPDYQGITPLHTCALYDKINIAQILLEHKPKGIQVGINVNIISVYREIPLHMLFLKKQTNFIDFIKLLLPKSNLNTPDYNGNTCFHLICKAMLWKKFKDILITKKLNIVAVNHNNEKPITYITEEDKQEFIDMIIDSYVHILTSSQKDWMNQWETDCGTNITKCREFTKKHIMSLLEKKTIECADRTYPLKSNIKCLKIPLDENVSISTFTGYSIDVLSGLIYLARKYNNVVSILPQKAWDPAICEKSKESCDFSPCLIMWNDITHVLFISDQITKIINDAIKDKKITYIVMNVFVVFEISGHANLLLYNKNTNELERFEPHGGIYGKQMIDEKLTKYFSKLIPNVKYIAPYQYMKLGFQMFDTNEKSYNTNIGDAAGFCLAWTYWYADMRIQFPSIRRDKLIKYIITQINDKNIRYRSVVRNYAANITKLRDIVLQSVGLDINAYINRNVTEKQYDELFNKFMEVIR